MKKTFFILSSSVICNLAPSMDPNLAALQNARYYSDCLKQQPLGSLPNQGTAEMRYAIRKEAREKYDALTQKWSSHHSWPLKPFEQCTWNDIEAAWNGGSGKLADTSSTYAKY